MTLWQSGRVVYWFSVVTWDYCTGQRNWRLAISGRHNSFTRIPPRESRTNYLSAGGFACSCIKPATRPKDHASFLAWL